MITTLTYDQANRLILANTGGALTTYTNDAAGNRTSMQTSIETVLYTWDAAGRMATADVTAGTVTFTYNPDGQRVVKQSTDGSAIGYLYDYKKLLAETDEVGGDVSTMYATTTDQEFGDLIGEDGEYSHMYDAQANTNALLDESGALEVTYKYYAFGNVASFAIEGDAWASLTVDQWANMTVDQWAGLPVELTTNMLAGGKKQYYLDPETELYLLGTGTNGRYYDGNTARFMSEDPIRQTSGDVDLYPYVNNNPVNKLDPGGHDYEYDTKLGPYANDRAGQLRLRGYGEGNSSGNVGSDIDSFNSRVNNLGFGGSGGSGLGSASGSDGWGSESGFSSGHSMTFRIDNSSEQNNTIQDVSAPPAQQQAESDFVPTRIDYSDTGWKDIGLQVFNEVIFGETTGPHGEEIGNPTWMNYMEAGGRNASKAIIIVGVGATTPELAPFLWGALGASSIESGIDRAQDHQKWWQVGGGMITDPLQISALHAGFRDKDLWTQKELNQTPMQKADRITGGLIGMGLLGAGAYSRFSTPGKGPPTTTDPLEIQNFNKDFMRPAGSEAPPGQDLNSTQTLDDPFHLPKFDGTQGPKEPGGNVASTDSAKGASGNHDPAKITANAQRAAGDQSKVPDPAKELKAKTDAKDAKDPGSVASEHDAPPSDEPNPADNTITKVADTSSQASDPYDALPNKQNKPDGKGMWLEGGKPGDGVFRITDKDTVRAITDPTMALPSYIDVTYKNGYPEFGPYVKNIGGVPGEVPIQLSEDATTNRGVRSMQDSDAADGAYANELNRKDIPGPNGKWTAKDVKAIRKVDDLMWHHHEDMKTMQLVSKGLNATADHLGGRTRMDNKLNLPRNKPTIPKNNAPKTNVPKTDSSDSD